MKLIYPNRISSVTADHEDAEYPADNTQDNYIGRPWKSDGATEYNGILTFEVAGITGTAGIGIAGTNAATIKITVYRADGTTVVDAETTYTAGATSFFGFLTGTGEYYDSLYVEYYDASYTTVAHVVEIEFDCGAGSGSVAHCGIVRIGEAYDFPNPKYGLTESFVDYSIVKQLNNGARYYRKRNIARKYSGNLVLKRSNEYWEFMHDFVKNNGQEPVFWHIVNDEQEFNLFAGFDGNLPTGNHENYSHCSVSFDILEAI